MSDADRLPITEGTDRTGVGDEFPDERTDDRQPGLSGGEYPGAYEQADEMSQNLESQGEATTFGGALGDLGPAGTIGTIDPGNAVGTPDDADTQYGLGPSHQ